MSVIVFSMEVSQHCLIFESIITFSNIHCLTLLFQFFSVDCRKLKKRCCSNDSYLGPAGRNTFLSHFEWIVYFCLFYRYLAACLLSLEGRSPNRSTYYCPELSLLCGIVHCTEVSVASLLPFLSFTHVFWKNNNNKKILLGLQIQYYQEYLK